MTDDDVQLFLSLKFSTIGEVVKAFKSAIKYPIGIESKYQVSDDMIMKAIAIWTEQGAQTQMDIKPDQVEFFLKVKFGTIENAYDHWVNTNPWEDHMLTDAEVKLVMDYVPKSLTD